MKSNLSILLMLLLYSVVILFHYSGISFWWDWLNLSMGIAIFICAILWPIFIKGNSNLFLLSILCLAQPFISYSYDNLYLMLIMIAGAITGLILYSKRTKLTWYKNLLIAFVILIAILSAAIGSFGHLMSKTYPVSGPKQMSTEIYSLFLMNQIKEL